MFFLELMRYLPSINFFLKLGLLSIGSLVFFFPQWPQFLHKSIPFRFVAFNILSFILPFLWFTKARKKPYPFLADIIFTLPLFLDIFGNAVFLFWTGWYDKLVHGFNVLLYGIFFVALILAIRPKTSPVVAALAAAGLSSLGHISWEVIEYFFQFIGGSDLHLTYEDTLFDLSAGVLGSLVSIFIARMIFSISFVNEELVKPLSYIFSK